MDVHEVDECAREHRADAKLDTLPRLRAAAVARLSGKQLAPVRTSGKRTRQAADILTLKPIELHHHADGIRLHPLPPEGRRRGARAEQVAPVRIGGNPTSRAAEVLTLELIEIYHRADGIQAAAAPA